MYRSLIYIHRISLEDDAKLIRQTQWRFNPTIKEVVKAVMLKLLDTSIIYPIADSMWVSSTQVISKKRGVIVIKKIRMERWYPLVLLQVGVCT